MVSSLFSMAPALAAPALHAQEEEEGGKKKKKSHRPAGTTLLSSAVDEEEEEEGEEEEQQGIVTIKKTDVAKMPLQPMASSLSSMAPAMAAPALTSVPLPSSSTRTSESSVTSSITYLHHQTTSTKIYPVTLLCLTSTYAAMVCRVTMKQSNHDCARTICRCCYMHM